MKILLEIDSDNNNGVYGGPNCTEWENIIKNHQYGVGKVIPPNHGDRDKDGIIDCWDGFSLGTHTQYSPDASAQFVPIKITIIGEADISDLYLVFDYSGPNYIAIPANKSTIPNVDPGAIRIWKKDGTHGRYGAFPNDGGNGDFVVKQYSHKATNLGFTSDNNTVTLYVEGLKENSNTKYYDDIKTGAKQSTKINVKLTDGNGNTLDSDDAKYVVAKTNTFYYLMATNQDVRAAVASANIYNREDLPKFGLQLSGHDPLTFESTSLVAYVNSKVDLTKPSTTTWLDWFANINDGFNAGVYYDYNSRKSLVAFQGTDFENWLVDWWDNASQYTVGVSKQYDKAMDIGYWIYNHNGLVDQLIFTGHSLGGGLASASMVCAVPASYTGSPKAVTFNAAALQAATLQKYIDANMINDGGRVAYNYSTKAREMFLSLAYIVRGEMLDTLQQVTPPRAFGGKQQLEHNLPLNSIDLIGMQGLDYNTIFSLYYGVNRVRLHLNDKVIEGLERLSGVRN